MLTVTNSTSGDRISYRVIVERQKVRGLLSKIATYGVIASATVIGTVLLARRIMRSPSSIPVTIEREAGAQTEATRTWKQKLADLLEEVTVPLF